MTISIKKLLGKKRQKKDRSVLQQELILKSLERIELSMRVMESRAESTYQVVNKIVPDIKKIADSMDPLSQYFEQQIKYLKKMEAVENLPPGKDDYDF